MCAPLQLYSQIVGYGIQGSNGLLNSFGMDACGGGTLTMPMRLGHLTRIFRMNVIFGHSLLQESNHEPTHHGIDIVGLVGRLAAP